LTQGKRWAIFINLSNEYQASIYVLIESRVKKRIAAEEAYRCAMDKRAFEQYLPKR